jgi:cell division septal protein FtsQ
MTNAERRFRRAANDKARAAAAQEAEETLIMTFAEARRLRRIATATAAMMAVSALSLLGLGILIVLAWSEV